MRRPALLAACLMLSACVYVPTRQKAAQGEPITPEQASFLYDAGRTLAQARERLGPPTLDLRDINVAVWSWRTSGDVWFYALPTTGTGESHRDYSLMVAYADDGRVLTHLLEKRGAWDTASEQARNWYRRIRHTLPEAAAVRRRRCCRERPTEPSMCTCRTARAPTARSISFWTANVWPNWDTKAPS